MNKTILVIEDEIKIRKVVRSYLENADFMVAEAGDGKSALTLFDRLKPDLVILDLMLPGESGESVCRALRRISRVPVIMLTAKAGEADQVAGFRHGADDYVTKPFSPRTLVARVQALLRRVSAVPSAAAEELAFDRGRLVISVPRNEVRVNRRSVALTKSEFGILACLAGSPGRVFSRDDLLHYALADGSQAGDRVIDSHIKALRKKIEADPAAPRYIETVFGRGYKFQRKP
jgi:DNA-binding response OmpR family regulator